MCPVLLALDSSPKSDDSFFSPPRRAARAHISGLGRKGKSCDFEGASGSTREEWDFAESGAHGEREEQDRGFCFLETLWGIGPLLGVEGANTSG